MALTLINLSDAQLSVYQGGEIVRESPGVAHIGEAGIVFGHDALAVSRHEPRGLIDKYWSQLDVVALSNPQKSCRHHADFAYHQLTNLIDGLTELGEVYFIVPSVYRRGELELLLGIAKALKFNTRGFIDGAVANVAAMGASAPNAQFVDLGLHRTCISQLSVANKISFVNVQSQERVGKKYLDELALNWIAASFLDQARFDPLAHAATEQALFNELIPWLSSLRRSEHINIGLDFHGRRHEVSLSKVDLINTLQPGIGLIAAFLDNAAPAILSSQFAYYPDEVISQLNGTVANPAVTFRHISNLLSTQSGTRDQVRLMRSLTPLTQQTLTAVAASDGA